MYSSKPQNINSLAFEGLSATISHSLISFLSSYLKCVNRIDMRMPVMWQLFFVIQHTFFRYTVYVVFHFLEMYTVDEEFSNPAAITVKCTVEFRNNANFVYPGLYAARRYTVVFILKILMGIFLKSSIYFVTVYLWILIFMKIYIWIVLISLSAYTVISLV